MNPSTHVWEDSFMAKSGMTPRMARRQGSMPPGKVTRSDSMNQGAFAASASIETNSVGSSFRQKTKTPPGTIAPGRVPRVRSSMHQ